MKPKGFYRLIGNKEPKKWILNKPQKGMGAFSDEHYGRYSKCKVMNRLLKRSGRHMDKLYIKQELENGINTND